LFFYPSNRPEADIDIDGPELDSPDVSGYHATASWVLTGGMRDYNCKSGILSKDKTAIGKNSRSNQLLRRATMKFLKTTFIGGLIFLVPVVVLAMVIGKAIGIMLLVAEPMAAFVPVDAVGGVAVANLVALIIVLVICFLAGLMAKTRGAKELANKVESSILNRIPGYAFIKGITSTLESEETANLRPVLVSLGSTARIGLEIEPVDDERMVVYFPGSPNAWSGIVQIVPRQQLKYINASMMSVIEHAEQLGRGTNKLVAAATSAEAD
jgi:uncharacterized membrane protein